MRRTFSISSLWLACLGLTLPACGHQHGATQGPPPESVTVTGSGDVSVTPDVAEVRLGIEARAAEVGKAVDQANATMAQITQSLKSLGIGAADLRTEGLSVHLERSRPEPPRPNQMGESASEQQTAVARNTLHVTVRKIGKVGDAIGAALGAGANQVYGLTFRVDDDAAATAKARTRAVEDAKRKAQALAEAAGAKLGKALFITEGSAGSPMPMSHRGMAMENATMPIEAGSSTVATRVTITYQLD